MNYHCDETGAALNYAVISEAVSAVCSAAPLKASWKRRIEEDFRKRGGRG